MMAENMQNGCVKLREGSQGPGLFQVLQASGNAYAEAHPTGDTWLQSMWKEGLRTASIFIAHEDGEVFCFAAIADCSWYHISPEQCLC